MTAERQPMAVTVAFSAAQLEHLGVPGDMTEDELAECLDEALLEDDGVLRMMIEEWIDKHAYDEENEMPFYDHDMGET